MEKQSAWVFFTRGAQFILHDLRLGIPILEKLFGFSTVLFLAVWVALMVHITSPYERYVVGQYMVAHIMVEAIDPQGKTGFKEPDNQEVTVPYTFILTAPGVHQIVEEVTEKGWWACKRGVVAVLVVIMGIGGGLWQWGKRGSREKHIKGDCLESEKAQRSLFLSRRREVSIAQVRLPQGVECGHMIFHGTTGTGKSTAIKALLDQIRLRGERAIIYDKSCHYVEEFYQPSDVLLNPLDARSSPWQVWAECRDAADFDSLAAAQIPMPSSSHDPFPPMSG